jgi:hypothetical protein
MENGISLFQLHENEVGRRGDCYLQLLLVKYNTHKQEAEYKVALRI